MHEQFSEPVKKRVGGSLGKVPVLARIAMLQANALVLRKQAAWMPPADDGTVVRKIVGKTR